MPTEVIQAAKGLQAKMKEKGNTSDKALTQALLGDNGALLPPEGDLVKLLSADDNAKWASLRRLADEAKRAVPLAPPVGSVSVTVPPHFSVSSRAIANPSPVPPGGVR